MSETASDILPSLSAEQTALFKSMEAEAATQRTTPDAVVPPAPAPAPAPQAPAAAPQPAPPGAPAADDDPAGVLASDGKRYVPVATHIDERNRLNGRVKDAEATITGLKTQLDTMMQVVQRMPQPKAEADPPKPETNPHNKDMDPLQWTQWELEKTQKLVEGLAGKSKETDEQRQQAARLTKAQETYLDAHTAFSKANTEFRPAYDWLMKKMTDMHTAMNYPENVAKQMALQLEWNTVVDAVNRNQNPMQQLWNMAKAMGYVPGAAPAGGTADDKVKAAAAAAEAAISLSGQPGSSPAQASLQSLVSMPKEQFAAQFQGANGQIDEDKWRKIAGGY